MAGMSTPDIALIFAALLLRLLHLYDPPHEWWLTLSSVDAQVNNARSKFKLDERIPEMAQNGKEKFEGLRHETREKINSSVDQADRTIEQKAAEAKGTVSGWFGSKK